MATTKMRSTIRAPRAFELEGDKLVRPYFVHNLDAPIPHGSTARGMYLPPDGRRPMTDILWGEVGQAKDGPILWVNFFIDAAPDLIERFEERARHADGLSAVAQALDGAPYVSLCYGDPPRLHSGVAILPLPADGHIMVMVQGLHVSTYRDLLLLYANLQLVLRACAR